MGNAVPQYTMRLFRADTAGVSDGLIRRDLPQLTLNQEERTDDTSAQSGVHAAGCSPDRSLKERAAKEVCKNAIALD
jgi:hypothetical protein